MSENEQVAKEDDRIGKAEYRKRVEAVMELVMQGASFSEIRFFAEEREWKVLDRQLYRYQDRAYKRLGKSMQRDSEKLIGQHVHQRRKLFSHSLRKDDCHTALQVLRDEASLSGLYPGKNGRESIPAAPARSPLSLRERTVGLLLARAHGDTKQAKLLQHLTPQRQYSLDDTWFPEKTLQVLTLLFVSDQLDLAGIWMNATSSTPADNSKIAEDPRWVATTTAYWYRQHAMAWQKFMQELGLEPDLLIKLHYRGKTLEVYDRKIFPTAPSVAQMYELYDAAGLADNGIDDIERYLESWRKRFAAVCPA